MFKGRFGMWITALIVFCLIQCLITFAPTWFQSNDLTINIDVGVDADLDEPLANKKIGGYKLRLAGENADVVIADNEQNLNGYTKYEGHLQSPLVLYARGLSSWDDGFIRVNTSNVYCHKIDLLSILQAIENDAEWDTLGINSRAVNGKVTLYIPSEQCAYYDDVVNLFYLTVNNGKMPSDEEMESLHERVNSILSKCHMVVDMKQAIYDEYDDTTKEHKVFIAPEYLYQRGGNSMGYGDDRSFMPAYFLNTVYLTADVYVRNAEADKIGVGNGFVESIGEKKSFMDKTGWRVKNSTFDLDSLSSAYLNTP